MLRQTICGMWGKEEGGGGRGGRYMVTINESIYCAKTASMFQNVTDENDAVLKTLQKT